MSFNNRQMLKPSNNGGIMDFFKSQKSNQTEESSPTPQPAAAPCVKQETSPGSATPLPQLQQGSPSVQLQPQEEESHETHTFEWCWGVKKPTTFTCNKPGTVEDTLKRSSKFREIANKNKNKELVILREGKAISSHFPCCLIQNKRLTVKYLKPVNNENQPGRGSVQPKRKVPSAELVMFHLPTKGGKNVVNIMKNPAIKRDIQEITIYAYKGEKVKQALRRDGRLLSAVIKNNRVLYRTENEVTTEMSDLVDDLDGKTFKIIHDKSSPPESLPSSLDDAYEAENEPETSDTKGSQISEMNAGQVRPQQSTTQLVSDNVPKEKPKEDDNKTSENMLCKIPDSKMMQEKLYSDFQRVVEGKKTERGSKLSRTQNLFRVEFGKNAQACRKVKTMRRLMDLSNSVCQVRINGNPGGSGFLLFDSFVLTNAHVVSNIYERSRQLDEKVTVHFSYESLEPMAAGFTVMEVVGYEYFQDESGNTYDWVLLRLHADENLPAGLLPNFGFIPQSGGICIIGHPDGGIKKIDPCMVIPTENRPQVVERHYHENPGGVVVDNSHYKGGQGLVHLLTDQFFGCVGGVQHNRQDLTYETSFYFGSSGSPVFDEHCNVVAMHSGGFSYSNARGELQSVLEYGHPLSTIMEHAIIQLVEKGRFDVLEKYLACPYARHQTVMSNVKALVERRNNTSFKCAVSINMAIYESDESLKTFLNFFNLKVEPVQMEID